MANPLTQWVPPIYLPSRYEVILITRGDLGESNITQIWNFCSRDVALCKLAQLMVVWPSVDVVEHARVEHARDDKGAIITSFTMKASAF